MQESIVTVDNPIIAIFPEASADPENVVFYTFIVESSETVKATLEDSTGLVVSLISNAYSKFSVSLI